MVSTRYTHPMPEPVERFHYRDPAIDALLDGAPAYCERCGNASLEGDELAAHIATCPHEAPDPGPPEGLPTIRRMSDVRVRERLNRPLWRRVVRRLRVVVDGGFKRCETCPSFHVGSAAYADHVADLVVAERADGSMTLIPRREVKEWPGAVHGRLSDAGWCSQHEKGVMPGGTCERWRA